MLHKKMHFLPKLSLLSLIEINDLLIGNFL